MVALVVLRLAVPRATIVGQNIRRVPSLLPSQSQVNKHTKPTSTFPPTNLSQLVTVMSLSFFFFFFFFFFFLYYYYYYYYYHHHHHHHFLLFSNWKKTILNLCTSFCLSYLRRMKVLRSKKSILLSHTGEEGTSLRLHSVVGKDLFPNFTLIHFCPN